jgi:hypothetical protein
VGCRIAHLAVFIFSEIGQELPFPAADPEARPTLLPAMASGGDDGRCPRSGSPHLDRRPAVQWWVPPLVRHLCHPVESIPYAGTCLGLLPCRDAGFGLLIGVGLHLLHMW